MERELASHWKLSTGGSSLLEDYRQYRVFNETARYSEGVKLS